MSLDDARDLFRAWAPESGRWSPWAKPVLFTYAVELSPSSDDLTHPPAESFDLRELPAASDGAALVVELPGASGVACALALADRGYRPVPLYNVTWGPGTNVVELRTLMTALRDATASLASKALADDAPPAFLIDSRRLEGTPQPEMYDNRWMVFPQDFPSSRMLASADIRRVVAIRTPWPLATDLRAVLRLWKRDGLEVVGLDPSSGATDELAFDLSIWAVLSDHLSSLWTGLRENSAGGFGGKVPVPGSAGGGFA